MSHVIALGYLGFEVSNVPAWERFATQVIGAALGERDADGSRALRVDERSRRLNLHPGASDDLAYAGFEVPDAAALGGIAERLREAGIEVRAASAERRRRRGVVDLIETRDPAGIPVEIFHGAAEAGAPFASPLVRSGFRTGAAGLGHVVVATPVPEESERFYREILGMKLSDRSAASFETGAELRVTFLRANPRHHSIALVAAPLPKRIHHFMLEVGALEDVGLAYERFEEQGQEIVLGLGQHPNDGTFSFYARTPSGFESEISWGGRRIDDATWEVRTYDHFSVWGHRPANVAPDLRSELDSGRIP